MRMIHGARLGREVFGCPWRGMVDEIDSHPGGLGPCGGLQVTNDADAVTMGFIDGCTHQSRWQLLVYLNEVDAGLGLPVHFLAHLPLVRNSYVDGVVHRCRSENPAGR